MTDLFGDTVHDPGGRSKSRILPGVSGDAIFVGSRSEYRPVLRRWMGEDFPDDYVLFIGMNPSVADASFNDPTIAREWSFCRSWDAKGMVKVNVSDYRMTVPKGFASLASPLQSASNAEAILHYAKSARLVVMAHGKLPRRLQIMGSQLTDVLRRSGVRLWCFALNGDGSPKHSLYVASGTPLRPF